MGSPYASNAATFLIQTLFGLYILVVMLRFLFHLVRADYYNPITQFVVRVTEPPLALARRLIPTRGRIDASAVVLMLLLQSIELWLLFSLGGGGSPALPGLVVLAFSELLKLLINVFFYSILIQVILSWVNPGSYHPVLGVLYSLTEPVLEPARRLVPPISGLDLSPLVVLIVLQLAQLVIVAAIRDLARAFM